jgi:gliding motility-associated-like protein
MKNLLICIFLFLSSSVFSQQILKLCDEDTLSIHTYTTNSGVPGVYFWSVDGGPEVIDGPSYDIAWNLYGSGWHIVSVRFEDGIGCPSDPISLNVNVEICATTTMWAPNCFTPDGDEVNNIWKPVGVNYFDEYFFIVNRWGNLIFESSNLNIGWDGTYGGKMCQDGVYVYVLRWKDWNGKLHQTHGHLTLLR